MLSAALKAWANLLIGWENALRGSYWSLRPPVTVAGRHTSEQGYAVSCLTPEGQSILQPEVTFCSHSSASLVNWCCLICFSCRHAQPLPLLRTCSQYSVLYKHNTHTHTQLTALLHSSSFSSLPPLLHLCPWSQRCVCFSPPSRVRKVFCRFCTGTWRSTAQCIMRPRDLQRSQPLWRTTAYFPSMSCNNCCARPRWYIEENPAEISLYRLLLLKLTLQRFAANDLKTWWD